MQIIMNCFGQVRDMHYLWVPFVICQATMVVAAYQNPDKTWVRRFWWRHDTFDPPDAQDKARNMGFFVPDKVDGLPTDAQIDSDNEDHDYDHEGSKYHYLWCILDTRLEQTPQL